MKNLKHPPTTRFRSVPRSEWPQDIPKHLQSPNLFAVWVNTKYLVQAFREPGEIVRLSITHIEGRQFQGFDQDGPRFKWQAGIPWEDLQDIKNHVGYANCDAVEVYPAQADVVNIANMRHLWVLPEKLAFAWRKDGERQ